MANYRRDRVNEEIKREMTAIIRDVKDPRISEAIIAVTAADCTADLKQCKIYYSVISGDDATEIKRGLQSANGFIRGQLAKRLNLRVTPELRYIPDTSAENGSHISSILNQLREERISRGAEEDPTGAEDADD